MELSIYFIYKLNVLDEFYIGSTIDIKKRFNSHKSDCNNKASKHKKVYVKMNEVCDFNDKHLLNYEILESLKCTKLEARTREQHYIDTLKPQLNSINAIKDIEAYRHKSKLYMKEVRENESDDDHRERLSKKKIWYDKNRDIILAKEKNRYNKKKIHDMKDKMKLMQQNLDLLLTTGC